MSKFMVGRLPIFDAKLGVHGYELLFCDSCFSRPSADAMTADVLVHAGLDMGLASFVGSKLAFVNATRSYLVGEHEIPFPPKQTVISVLEDVPRDDEVLEGCQRLAKKGYALAADEDCGSEDDPLLELVSMVKVDVLGLSSDELQAAVARRPHQGVKLVAKRVESRDQLGSCKKFGFDLFQGHLLSCPEVIEGQTLSPNRLICLRILEKLCDPSTSANEVADIVKTDAALSYRFLRLAGAGAASGLSRRLSSVREGVVLVGERRLRDWVALMLLADLHKGSDEQLNIAMTRARMAEIMAKGIDPSMAEQAFTAGLVSALELLLRSPLPEVLRSLSLTVELEDAILGRKGLLGGIIDDVLAWEVGSCASLRSGLGMVCIADAYLEALAWSTKICGALEVSH
jgi:EAL and modified HD-GYP domain-containing signal transduction protein